MTTDTTARVSGTINDTWLAAIAIVAEHRNACPPGDTFRRYNELMGVLDDARRAAIQPDPEPQPVAWADVKGFEENYEVSSAGDLRSKKTGKTLAKNLAGSGYVKAEMWKNGERHQTYIHRLVADAFVQGDGNEVNHKNGIKTDNRSTNLEWCTRSENVEHGYYTLCYRIQAVTATNPETGEVRNYRSVEECVRDGFDSGNVYRAINNPGRRVKGFTFEKATPSCAGIVSVEAAVLRDALKLAAARLQRLGLEIPSTTTLRADAFEWADEALRALAGERG